MFADNTNLFYSHKNIKTLFQIVNSELKLVNEWVLANKVSLNAKKTKYVLFHKESMRDSLPSQLPTMTFNSACYIKIYLYVICICFFVRQNL